MLDNMTNLTWQDKCTAKQAGAAGKIPIEWRLTSKILQQVDKNELKVRPRRPLKVRHPYQGKARNY